MKINNEEYYQIGEASKITGISKDTLHFYTKAGLVTPDYIDPDNHYHYYSRWNMYQLDIITTCKKLGIPLEKVRQIVSSKDNEKVVSLLMEYRQEALRLSQYYQHVADDILWYHEENEQIKIQNPDLPIYRKYFESETVLTGGLTVKDTSYHASLQDAIRQELSHSDSIRRKYGYVLDTEHLLHNKLLKCREYVKLPNTDYASISSEHLMTLPSGDYAVFTLQIRDEQADFSSFLEWLEGHHFTTDMVFAEESGLQLFKYIHNYYCTVKAHLIPISE